MAARSHGAPVRTKFCPTRFISTNNFMPPPVAHPGLHDHARSPGSPPGPGPWAIKRPRSDRRLGYTPQTWAGSWMATRAPHVADGKPGEAPHRRWGLPLMPWPQPTDIDVYMTLAIDDYEAAMSARPVRRWQLGDPGDPGQGVLPEHWPWRPDHPEHESFVSDFWDKLRRPSRALRRDRAGRGSADVLAGNRARPPLPHPSGRLQHRDGLRRGTSFDGRIGCAPCTTDCSPTTCTMICSGPPTSAVPDPSVCGRTSTSTSWGSARGSTWQMRRPRRPALRPDSGRAVGPWQEVFAKSCGGVRRRIVGGLRRLWDNVGHL